MESGPYSPIFKYIRWGYKREIPLLESNSLKRTKLFGCVYTCEALKEGES